MKNNRLLHLFLVLCLSGSVLGFTLTYYTNTTFIECNLTTDPDDVPIMTEELWILNASSLKNYTFSYTPENLTLTYNAGHDICSDGNQFSCGASVLDENESEAYSQTVNFCSTSTSTSTSTSPSSTTTSPSSSTSSSVSSTTTYFNYGSLPGLNGSSINNGSGGLGNTTGLGSTILGLQTTDFLKYLALGIILTILLGLGSISIKFGTGGAAIATIFFVLVLPWLSPIPVSLLLVITFLCVIPFFIGGKQ
jgi:hypothetical protein